MLTLIFTASILINFIESKYLLVETKNKNDGEADYSSIGDACDEDPLPWFCDVVCLTKGSFQ